jgi:hypothetical protein
MRGLTMNRFTLILVVVITTLSALIIGLITLMQKAEFRVHSLVVTPIVASPGQAVTVEAKVDNVGGREGSCIVHLAVYDSWEQEKNVTVAPGATETVTFTLVKNVSGVYVIEVNGQVETLRVKQPGVYPRLGNCYGGSDRFFWRWKEIPSAERNSVLNSLARYDLIVVHYDIIRSAPEAIRFIRKQNPQIKILAYIEAGSGGFFWHWLLTHDLEAEVLPSYVTKGFVDLMHKHAVYFKITAQDSNESFFLHYADTPGNPTPPEQRRFIIWTNPRNRAEWPAMNPTGDWANYLPHFVHDKVMASELFDGVYYDIVVEPSGWSNMDVDNDGFADDPTVVCQEYKKGMARLLQLTRELLGPEAIILGNPGGEWSSDSPYFEYANGHMQENALGIWNQWPELWDIYQRNMQKPAPPSRIHWIDVSTDNTTYDNFNPDLPTAALQKMRLGLAITLLDDGYFGFRNEWSYDELWWFPEYDANLGLATGSAQERSDGSWMRKFENGVVVANPTGDNSTITSNEMAIEFATTYKDITTGIEGTSFIIPPKDGRIFLATEQ